MAFLIGYDLSWLVLEVGDGFFPPFAWTASLGGLALVGRVWPRWQFPVVLDNPAKWDPSGMGRAHPPPLPTVLVGDSYTGASHVACAPVGAGICTYSAEEVANVNPHIVKKNI